MIRLSAGTAAVLGMKSLKMETDPTTAYLLSGNRCLMQCSFCPRGGGEKNALPRLGRVSWPAFPWEEVEKSLGGAAGRGVRRICLQSVRHEQGIAPLLEQVARIRAVTALPLSLSAWIRDEGEAERLIAAGVERLSISLDAANPAAHERFKGGSLERRLDLLLRCAGNMPDRMSTHIICGLGESEEEALALVNRLHSAGVTVALFAFFPIRGTALEHLPPPVVDAYRRVQAAAYLLKKGIITFSSLQFRSGRLVSFGIGKSELFQHLAGGAAFRTGGCPDCNRPYYNERPGGEIYNYPRALTEAETAEALEKLAAHPGP